MRRLVRIGSLALGAVLAASAIGAAPSAASPPGGDDEDVALRRLNLSSNPLVWPGGIFGFTVGFAPHRHVAVRGDVTYYAIVDSEVRGHELSVGVPLYPRRAFEGPFLEPGFTAIWLQGVPGEQAVATPLDGYGGKLMGPQLLVGWAWMWRGLNLAVAAGGVKQIRGDTQPVVPNAYLRFGYAF